MHNNRLKYVNSNMKYAKILDMLLILFIYFIIINILYNNIFIKIAILGGPKIFFLFFMRNKYMIFVV